MKSIRTHRKPASAIIFISPGWGSVKWMFTPRPCSIVSELVFGSQPCGQLVKVRSAEIESERKTERNVRLSRSLITVTGLDRNPKGPAVRNHPRTQLSLRIQARERDPANASAKSPLDRDG